MGKLDTYALFDLYIRYTAEKQEQIAFHICHR